MNISAIKLDDHDKKMYAEGDLKCKIDVNSRRKATQDMGPDKLWRAVNCDWISQRD